MWQEFLIALSLVFVIEGIMPFVSPRQWRHMLVLMVRLEDHRVRIMGLTSMLIGIVLLYLVH